MTLCHVDLIAWAQCNRVMAHVIRLRGPWESQVQDRSVRFARRFHKPTGLDPGERVLLTVKGLRETAVIWLNERRLVETNLRKTPHLRLDITPDLKPTNLLWIDCEPMDAPTFAVALEIEPG